MTTATPTSLLGFFQGSARRFPEGLAIEVPPGRGRPERRCLNYAELEARADALAARLTPQLAADRIAVLLLGRAEPALYVAQLAVLRSGAAFTCLDPSFPDGYIEEVCRDARAPLFLSDAAGLARVRELDLGDARRLDVTAAAEGAPAARGRPVDAARPEDLAYVIYTSGTTGKPKGVLIEHRSIANLVASDLEEFGLGPRDRVAQVSSPAYDSSVEETWLAFAAGATLVVVDEDTQRLGPDLVPWLRAERISVLCPPPTLLRMTTPSGAPPDLPALHLVYAGGEAMTEDVVRAWSPGRRLVNGYGPTECTVTVVRGDVHAGVEVTIGRPLRGHEAWLLNGEGEILEGEGPGELCIGGVGLARGYLGRPESTARRFVEHPRLGRIFRTGDLCARTADGRFLYRSRIDAQVKLRGHRIELEAIEARLARVSGVAGAVCTVQRSQGRELLTAHIVPDPAVAPPDFGELAARLSRELPAHMLPRLFGWLDELPRGVSGKVDRSALPVIDTSACALADDDDPSLSDSEARVALAFRRALGPGTGRLHGGSDFFLDLGGDSLSAVEVVCELRQALQGAQITTRDIYEARTLAGIAERLEECLSRPRPEALGKTRAVAGAAPGAAPPILRTTLVQGVCLLAGLVLAGFVSYVLVFECAAPALQHLNLLSMLLLVPLVLGLGTLLYCPLALGALVLAKWILIGRYRAGRAPVWGGFYLRHWIVTQVAGLVPWRLLAGTSLVCVALRCLGARIGRRVHLHRGVDLQRGGWDLLELGDDVTLAQDATLMLSDLEAGQLVLGSVVIGAGATIDVRASVGPGCVVEAGGFLTALSWLEPGARLGAGERWDGLPAEPAGRAPQVPALEGAALSPFSQGVELCLTRAALSWLAWLPVPLGIWALARVYGVDAAGVAGWLQAPAWSVRGVAFLAAGIVPCTALALLGQALLVRALGEVRPGTFPRLSRAYLRVWLKTGRVEAAGRWLSGTLFWPHWLRLAGMRIGQTCEVSSIIDVVPERVQIGPASFLADGIYLGGPALHRGSVTIGDTRLGAETFLGNHVVVPTGAQLPPGSFYGVCTVVDSARQVGGRAWFGHPPLELPRRDVVLAERGLTHEPSPWRYATRLCWEAARLGLPILPLVLALAWVGVVQVLGGAENFAVASLVVAPLASAGVAAVLCAAVLLLKWGLLGRARPGQHALWSCWCSRWDFLYVAWQFYARGILARLEGSLFLAVFLRGMGVRVGKRVVLGAGFAQVVDPDMLHLGDDSTVNALFQAHSFEDRVLKLDHIHVGRGASLAQGSVVFYGAHIGDSVQLAPHAVVMKNEHLAAGQRYARHPCEPEAPVTSAGATRPR